MTVYYICVILRVGGNTMLVIGYSDFSADMNKYLETAAVSGLKILPQKKEKKLSARQRKFAQAIERASGIIPLNVDLDSAKTEAILKV